MYIFSLKNEFSRPTNGFNNKLIWHTISPLTSPSPLSHPFPIPDPTLQPLDSQILVELRGLLKRRASIDAIFDVQSQWIGPNAFSFKAEVDFDGTWLATQVCCSRKGRGGGCIKGDVRVTFSFAYSLFYYS
jgi:hypothetical protein